MRSVEQLIEYGVINLNKPAGPTSHMAADYVKKILCLNKVGHGGSLDPGVTGVLPVALGKATRIVQALLVAPKEYVCIMRLHKDVPEETIRKVCKEFIGKITQLPPVKSSVKRVLRQRNVYEFEILEIKGKEVLFRCKCQAGTYIRKICHDIGLKTGGANMYKLLRTKAGPFTYKDMVTLQDIEDAYWFWKNEGNEKYIRKIIRPIEDAITHLPKVWADAGAIGSLSHGISLKMPGVLKHDEFNAEQLVAVMTPNDELIALGNAAVASKDFTERGVAVKVHTVFMQAENSKI